MLVLTGQHALRECTGNTLPPGPDSVCSDIVLTKFEIPFTPVELYTVSRNATYPRDVDRFGIQFPTPLAASGALEVFRHIAKAEKPPYEMPLAALAFGRRREETRELRYPLDAILELIERDVGTVVQVRLLFSEKFFAWINTPDLNAPMFSYFSAGNSLPAYFTGIAHRFLDPKYQRMDLGLALNEFQRELRS